MELRQVWWYLRTFYKLIWSPSDLSRVVRLRGKVGWSGWAMRAIRRYSVTLTSLTSTWRCSRHSLGNKANLVSELKETSRRSESRFPFELLPFASFCFWLLWAFTRSIGDLDDSVSSHSLCFSASFSLRKFVTSESLDRPLEASGWMLRLIEYSEPSSQTLEEVTALFRAVRLEQR